MLVRHAGAARDSEACAMIYAPFVHDGAVSFEELAPSPNEMGGRIERISLTHPFLVAEDDSHVLGFAYAGAHRERAAYRWAADVSVYVDAGHRRAGLGRGLYGALFGLLVRQGLRVACAGITLPNEASVALHESLGFRPVGIYRQIGWKAGAWRDVGWWQLELAGAGGPGIPAEPGGPVRLEDSPRQ